MAVNIVCTLHRTYADVDGKLEATFGLTSIMSCLFMSCLLLYDLHPVRSMLKKMPYWNVLGSGMRKQIGCIRYKV